MQMEIVTAWGTAREALSERPGFAALKDAGAVWRREKRYQHVEDAARQFTCFEVSGPEEPASNTPAPVSQKIWQALADQDRMILRLQRDVGRQDIEEAAWLYQVHTDIPDDVAGEYNEWYDKEHLPRLVTVPGVLRARRYAAIGGEGPRYLTAYDLSDPDAFESPQGLVARKTPWTARMRSLFFNTRRNMCKLITAN